MTKIDVLGYSPFYCPPEISSTGKSLISTKSDVFSFRNVYFLFII